MAPKAQGEKVVRISPVNMEIAEFEIEGFTPYCQHRFGEKAKNAMREKQEAGSTARGKTKREAKDFDVCYEAAMYRSTEGWRGIPAGGIRTAMIEACKNSGKESIASTLAKKAIFIVADGYDQVENKGLVRITKGEPTMNISPCRNSGGLNKVGTMDLRARPLWAPGWRAKVKVEFDADVFRLEDIANLLHRAGYECGIGEGRPTSRISTGCDWGRFRIVEG